MTWSVPKRYIKLTLFDGRENNTKVLSEIDVSFKIEMKANATVSGAAQEAHISIWGLKRETMNYLSTSFSLFNNNIIKNKIEVDAGYENKHGIIFSGQIFEAVPHLETADYYIELRCMSGFSKMIDEEKNYSFKGIYPLRDILSQIATDNNLVFVNGLNQSYVVENYSVSDLNIYGHLRKLSVMTNLDIWIYNGKLYVTEKGGRSVVETLKIDQSNLIGSPRPHQTGCQVSITLNPSVVTGMTTVLKTERFKELNTTEFRTETISHVLDTKGNTWATKLNLINKDIYEKKSTMESSISL